MPVPKYDEFMKPLLDFLADGNPHTSKEAHQALANTLHLTDDDRQELLPGSGNIMYKNRIGWAATYLKKAGLISSPARSVMQITQLGKKTLAENPLKIDARYLSKFESFRGFTAIHNAPATVPGSGESSPVNTPEDQLKQSYEMIQSKLADELYEKVMSLSPEKFEYLVLKLVRAVGYGYPDEGSFHHVGKTGDGGVDGIIHEDKFAFNQIYIQAKHWNESHSVGSSDIRDFYGAMAAGDKSHRGVFVTTSTFTDAAKKTAKDFIDRKMILIDKDELLRLMIENNVGVVEEHSFVIKRVDENTFDEEE